jgi:hypothetical protein
MVPVTFIINPSEEEDYDGGDADDD